MTVWQEKYIAEYGGYALSDHWEAAGCTKFKTLRKKITNHGGPGDGSLK
jgi:hypothetical protein